MRPLSKAVLSLLHTTRETKRVHKTNCELHNVTVVGRMPSSGSMTCHSSEVMQQFDHDHVATARLSAPNRHHLCKFILNFESCKLFIRFI